MFNESYLPTILMPDNAHGSSDLQNIEPLPIGKLLQLEKMLAVML